MTSQWSTKGSDVRSAFAHEKEKTVMEEGHQQAFYESCRNTASWMLLIVGMPRAILGDESRMVQFVGLPPGAQYAFMEWASEKHMAVISAAQDGDGILRSVPEPLWHDWIMSLFLNQCEQ